MPAQTMTLREKHLLYYGEQNEQPIRHEGAREQGHKESRKEGETRDERKRREERKYREDKENRGNSQHRRHRSVRERSEGRTERHVENRRHSQIQETAVQRAIRHISYQPGAEQQPCGHWMPTNMDPGVFYCHDQVAHRDDINSPYAPWSTRTDLDPLTDFEPQYISTGPIRHVVSVARDPVVRASELVSRDAPSPTVRQPVAIETSHPVYPSAAHPSNNRRSVAIDSDVVYVSEPSYSGVTSPPPAHVAPPRRSQSYRSGPQHAGYDGSKPLPAPPHPRGPNSSSALDPELQPPYWMETIGHAIWTLGITLAHIIGTAATSLLIFILGAIHCILTSVLLVVGTVIDGLTTMLRVFFNLITCHCQSGEWGWEWTHLTRAWTWGRKSQWVREFVGRVNTETEERDEKVAKRLSLHEARKEEYKREQEEKARMQGQGPVIPANKRHGVAALYGGQSMAYDVEQGYGSGPGSAPSSRAPYY